MRKLLLIAMGAMMSMASFAQEQDVTSYIQNPGFDEDLTWQTDGSTKEIIDKTVSLSGRSFAYQAADNSVYASTKTSGNGNWKRTDVTFSWNGFIGHIQGWNVESNKMIEPPYDTKDKTPEWVYFGTVPYGLSEKAIPIADDNNGSFLTVPEKPAADAGDDNKGALYLRAGWGARAIYKQVVNLPCAVYRMDYWVYNHNYEGSKNNTSVKNLCQVTCRKDVFTDEDGFNAQEWTLHSIEFTPTSEFTIQFGFESAGGSASNPFLFIDGIKLYKIGEADPLKLLQSDLLDLAATCDELIDEALAKNHNGLAGEISDYKMDIEEMAVSDDQAEMEANIKTANARIAAFREAIAAVDDVDGMLQKMDNLLKTTDYAGKADLQTVYDKIQAYQENEQGLENLCELVLAATAECEAAIKAYIITQQASAEQPADFTLFVQHPWFINANAEPVLNDGIWEYPLRYDEEGTDRYVSGSASSPDLNSTGWYIAGASGGDQRLNFQADRSCWNAWNSNFTTTVAIAQDIEGLPNGYYTVTADLITQSGYANGTQRVFAKSIAEKKTSTKALESEGYDYAEWETVAMTADDKVLVIDGKLTIGAEGTGDGNASAGWFLATNFHLNYLGAAPADAAKNALDAKVAAANEMADQMKFKADQKALKDSINQYASSTDYIKALTALTEAMTEAEKSIAKYTDYLPEEVEDIDSKTLLKVKNTLRSGGGDGYEAAEDIMQYAYDYVMGWIACDTATYTKFDAQVDLLKNYLNTYTPAYNNAAEATLTADGKAKEAIEALMAAQKAALVSEMKDQATVNEYVEALKDIVALAEKQSIYETGGTDYTAFIKNPKLESESGWTFVKGNGNNNTNGGQWLSDTSTRYIDSYNGSGLQGYSATQLITGLPNGTYTVGVYTRTPAEGAYILNAVGNDTTFVEIPLDYYMGVNEDGEEVQMIASDSHGPIWEAAKAAYEAGDNSDEVYNIYNTNVVEGEGIGRGWKHQEMTGIVVTNHELLIGAMTGTESSKTEKVFGGNWFSAGGWTLTQTAQGDNQGWEGPIATEIASVKEANRMADGIYTLTGVKSARLQRGVNIIISGGKAQKVLVK